jgi:hypothetical protein
MKIAPEEASLSTPIEIFCADAGVGAAKLMLKIAIPSAIQRRLCPIQSMGCIRSGRKAVNSNHDVGRFNAPVG